jgi:polyphenol oxidase
MPFHQPDTVRYYSFDLFEDLPVTHAVYTRQGGISPAPWQSLNMGSTVGDDLLRVSENRRRALVEMGKSPNSVYDVWQVHSTEVVCAKAPRGDRAHIRADAIFTDQLEVTLMMRFADCVPILLADPAHRVVGIVHAGWIGTVNFVLRAALETMIERYGALPPDIYAAIGPSIGAHHYTVGSEVIEQVQASFGSDADALLPTDGEAVKFDLWSANRLILEQCGVGHIEVAGICTACHLEDWYSHRGEHGKTGRFGAMISLRD